MSILEDNQMRLAKENFKSYFVDEMVGDYKYNPNHIAESWYRSELSFDDALGFVLFLNENYTSELAVIISNSVERLNEEYIRQDEEYAKDLALCEYREIVLDVLHMYASEVVGNDK
ncbi:hypothetical protein [Staphylococcus capitis]|uniref:hypothetical protein n=1 Tax=Staphylococcus capitis TaxID=29388 RepID=UPI00145ABE9F|nr:hypothetical protein [Staphylococcus capitis]NMK92041.1 hypothetical protein [Staphylococcus capitis]